VALLSINSKTEITWWQLPTEASATADGVSCKRSRC